MRKKKQTFRFNYELFRNKRIGMRFRRRYFDTGIIAATFNLIDDDVFFRILDVKMQINIIGLWITIKRYRIKDIF